MKSFISDVLRTGFTKVLMVIFGLSTSVILARLLGPEDNGIIASLLVYPNIFMSFGSLGIRQSTAYFLGKKIFTENQLKSAIIQIWILVTLVSICSCYLLMQFLSKTEDDIWLVILVLIAIPFNLLNTYLTGIFLGKNQIKNFNQVVWVPSLITFVLTTILLFWFQMGIKGYLIALIGGPVFMNFILLKRNKFFQIFNFNGLVIKKMLGLGMLYALALLVNNLNYRIDIIIMDIISSPYETGIYSKGVSLAEYLWQVPMVLSTIIFARSSTSKNDKAFSIKITQLLRLSLILVCIVSIPLYFLSEFIIVMLFGKAFTESVIVFNLLLPGIILFTFFSVLNMDLAGKGKPWVSLIAMIPALAINILLNYQLIPKNGAEGAALASTISYSIGAVLFIFLYSRETKISFLEIISYQASDFTPVFQLLKSFNR